MNKIEHLSRGLIKKKQMEIIGLKSRITEIKLTGGVQKWVKMTEDRTSELKDPSMEFAQFE